jgi:hypothetical protein
VTALVAARIDEPLVPATLLGGMVVLLGMWLVQRGVA